MAWCQLCAQPRLLPRAGGAVTPASLAEKAASEQSCGSQSRGRFCKQVGQAAARRGSSQAPPAPGRELPWVTPAEGCQSLFRVSAPNLLLPLPAKSLHSPPTCRSRPCLSDLPMIPTLVPPLPLYCIRGTASAGSSAGPALGSQQPHEGSRLGQSGLGQDLLLEVFLQALGFLL